MDRMELMMGELKAVEKLAKQIHRLNMTPVVDDEYIKVRRDYELALEETIEALRMNGRITLTDKLHEFSAINLRRSLRWHPTGLNEWNAAEWSNAMAGEAGEVCNATKKLRRLECGLQQNKGPQTRQAALTHIAKEIGDTIVYADLLCQYLGLDLAACIKFAFNDVSEREGFPERLP